MAGKKDKAGTHLLAIQTISIIKQFKDFEGRWHFIQHWRVLHMTALCGAAAAQTVKAHG